MLGIVALSLVAVLRETLETVLFMTTLVIIDSSGALTGTIVASATVILLGVLLMKGISRLDLNNFFQGHECDSDSFCSWADWARRPRLIEAGESSGIGLGVLGQRAFDINPPRNPDGTYPLLHEEGAVGSVLGALVGYTGSPEWLRIIAYLGCWLTLGTYVFLKHQRTKRS